MPKPMTVATARRLAFEMHGKQTDKLGDPYNAHLEAVRLGVQMLGGGVDEQIAALFHDAVEDHHTTLKALRETWGVSEKSMVIIEAVTKGLNEGQEHYLDRIIKAGDGAMRVKVADIMHNLRYDRLERLKHVKTGKGGKYNVERLQKKYRPALARLMMELGLLVSAEEQKELIASKPYGTGGSGWSSGANHTYSGGYDSQASYQVQSIITGDWVKEWDAPVAQKLSQNSDELQRFLLANGEVKEVKKHGKDGKVVSFKIVTEYAWSSKWFDEKKLGGGRVSRDQIEAYEEMLIELKKLKHSDVFDELADELDGFLPTTG